MVTILVLSACGSSGATGPSGGNGFTVHEDISVTVFWIGEEGNEENGYIPNLQSTWDDNWIEHYGGIDDPENRNGFFPAEFTPLENPFYFALPYSDFDDDGNRKNTAYDVVYWAGDSVWEPLESMCKNRWIMVVWNGKTAYAQWEDAGPFGEDDFPYVFGNADPENSINDGAGLDVSPAVRDYLGLSGLDQVNWRFVETDSVPGGPWKAVVTDSDICWE